MPFKEATFWYGTILFTTGIYFWIVGGDRVTIGIILTVIGLVMSVYAVIAEHYPSLPKVPAWVALLLITWVALGYDAYDRYRPAGPPSVRRVGIIVIILLACAVLFVLLKTRQRTAVEDEIATTKQETTAQIEHLTKQHEFEENRSHQIRDEALADLRAAKENAARPRIIPAINRADASWVRFITAYAEIALPPEPGKQPASRPQKARCEFLNCTDISYKIRVLNWDNGARGLDAGVIRTCLQLRIANNWWPIPDGVEELHVAPGESFRFWVFPKAAFENEQFKARVALGNLGIVHLWINGQEVTVSVG